MAFEPVPFTEELTISQNRCRNALRTLAFISLRLRFPFEAMLPSEATSSQTPQQIHSESDELLLRGLTQRARTLA